MHKKVYLRAGGGLGDVIREYLKDNRYWRRLKAFKLRYPETSVKAVLCCHNAQAKDFLECNPYLDSVEVYPWQLDGTPIFEKHSDGYVFMGTMWKNVKSLKDEEPKVYLTNEEETRVKQILNSHSKLIVIHPFAGGQDRMPLPPSEYCSLIDNLIESDYTVAVVGGTYLRQNQGGDVYHEETFTYQRDGLLNLVGEANSRTIVRLIQGASGFIGTHSCYVLPAWIQKLRTVLIAPDSLQKHLSSGDANSWVTRSNLPFNKIVYINQSSDYDLIKKQAFNFIRGA